MVRATSIVLHGRGVGRSLGVASATIVFDFSAVIAAIPIGVQLTRRAGVLIVILNPAASRVLAASVVITDYAAVIVVIPAVVPARGSSIAIIEAPVPVTEAWISGSCAGAIPGPTGIATGIPVTGTAE
jgi:hypothetical protein